MTDAEQPLTGGNVAGAVTRVGRTVRKPTTPATPLVHEYLARLGAAGVDCPTALGTDAEGRQVLEFVPGESALLADPLTVPELARVGRMIRSIHDASEGFEPTAPGRWDVVIPSPERELICHNDLGPWNLVLGPRWVFIDWDGAGPSSRSWDLAYAAVAFTLSDAALVPAVAAARLVALVDGYRAAPSLRARLPRILAERSDAMLDLLASSHRVGREPWASMYVDGHGEHWRSVSEYVHRHSATWGKALGEA